MPWFINSTWPSCYIMAKPVRGCLCEGQLLLFYSYDTERERGGEGKGNRESQKREPPTPMIPWECFTNTPKMPGKPIVVFAPSRSLFQYARQVKEKHSLGKKGKDVPFCGPPANTKRSIVLRGWRVVGQTHASLPSPGSFEDTQRAAALVAVPQVKLSLC